MAFINLQIASVMWLDSKRYISLCSSYALFLCSVTCHAGRNIHRSSSPTPAQNRGSLGPCPKSSLEHLQGWGFHHLPGQSVPIFDHCHGKIDKQFFLFSCNQNFPYSNLPFCFLSCHQAPQGSSGSIFFVFSDQVDVDSSKVSSCLRLNRPCFSQHLLEYHVLPPQTT